MNGLRGVSSLPILLADFGLTGPQLALLAEYNITPMNAFPTIGSRYPWFLKPAAIEIATLQWATSVCWLDTDIQVLPDSDWDSIFGLFEPGKLALAVDRFATTKANRVVWNSGVVGATEESAKQPSLLNTWANHCLDNPPQRGDQEVLEALVHRRNYHDLIIELPEGFNWQRAHFMGGNVKTPDPLHGLHWTGPIGKQYIREHLIYTNA